MSRVSPTPVEVLVDGAWIRGIVRTCEVTPDGESCSAVVSFGPPSCVTTKRFEPARMRHLSGEPGCPVAHGDESSCA